MLQLADETGPRRHPHLERLSVQRVRTPPGPELNGQIATRKRWRKKGVVCVRNDLLSPDTQPGGLRNPFIVPSQAAAARDAENNLRDKLSAQGYTVNGNMQVWR